MNRCWVLMILLLCAWAPYADADATLISRFKIWPAHAAVPKARVHGYSLSLRPGSQRVYARYATFSGYYDCLFEWRVVPGGQYEIIDMNQPLPLTLYRLEQVSTLYQRRRDMIIPVGCRLNVED